VIGALDLDETPSTSSTSCSRSARNVAVAVVEERSVLTL
jgi:hypothetical protein